MQMEIYLAFTTIEFLVVSLEAIRVPDLYNRFVQQDAGSTLQRGRYANFVVFGRHVILVFMVVSNETRDRGAYFHAEAFDRCVFVCFQNNREVLHAGLDTTDQKYVCEYNTCDAARSEIERNFWHATRHIRYISWII